MRRFSADSGWLRRISGTGRLHGNDPWRSVAWLEPGRLSEVEITVYKAMGLAMEDMVAANLAYQRAKREGGGHVMDW